MLRVYYGAMQCQILPRHSLICPLLFNPLKLQKASDYYKLCYKKPAAANLGFTISPISVILNSVYIKKNPILWYLINIAHIHDSA